MGLDYHLGQELVVEDALGEYEPVPLLLPQPDLCEQTWIISEKMKIQTRLLRGKKMKILIVISLGILLIAQF